MSPRLGIEHDERHPDQDAFALEYVSQVPRERLPDLEREAVDVFELIRPLSEQWNLRSATVNALRTPERPGHSPLRQDSSSIVDCTEILRKLSVLRSRAGSMCMFGARTHGSKLNEIASAAAIAFFEREHDASDDASCPSCTPGRPRLPFCPVLRLARRRPRRT